MHQGPCGEWAPQQRAAAAPAASAQAVASPRPRPAMAEAHCTPRPRRRRHGLRPPGQPAPGCGWVQRWAAPHAQAPAPARAPPPPATGRPFSGGRRPAAQPARPRAQTCGRWPCTRPGCRPPTPRTARWRTSPGMAAASVVAGRRGGMGRWRGSFSNAVEWRLEQGPPQTCLSLNPPTHKAHHPRHGDAAADKGLESHAPLPFGDRRAGGTARAAPAPRLLQHHKALAIAVWHRATRASGHQQRQKSVDLLRAGRRQSNRRQVGSGGGGSGGGASHVASSPSQRLHVPPRTFKSAPCVFRTGPGGRQFKTCLCALAGLARQCCGCLIALCSAGIRSPAAGPAEWCTPQRSPRWPLEEGPDARNRAPGTSRTDVHNAAGASPAARHRRHRRPTHAARGLPPCSHAPRVVPEPL